MRVVFMGTPAFAASILEEVAQQHEVAAVYTRPDAVRGRGGKLVPSPVKQVAAELGIPVLTPRTLRDGEVQRGLADLRPDVACVAAYGAILPPEVLAIPRFGCLNVHASLLPRWRGAAPSSAPSWRATKKRACASCAWRRGWTRARGASAGRRAWRTRTPASFPRSLRPWARRRS